MYSDSRIRITILVFVLFPVAIWLCAASYMQPLTSRFMLFELIQRTPSEPLLYSALITGILCSFGVLGAVVWLTNSQFSGAPFQKFFRGTQIVSLRQLKRRVEQKEPQVTVAGIPMPIKVEPLHLLLNGATGTGKSVILRELVYSAMLRGDRMVIVDPNGDMYSKFGRDKDVLLNPYDKRTQGWTFYNEIRHDYDFQRYAYSIVPKGQTPEAEEWASYGRLLLRECAKKLDRLGNTSVKELFHWATIESPDNLRKFLRGTMAESLFVGSSEATKALSSARFILSDKLPEHVSMPAGNFSIRDWLADSTGGNLYITWREDMGPALKPLISAWVDVVCTSVLSMTEDHNRRIWLIIDELASLEKLASLEDALTKGRKHGLRVVAGLQSTSQAEHIYGVKEAQTLRSCFRSLVVLGGSRTDPKTNEDMSLSLGEHEVERVRVSKSTGQRNQTSSRSTERVRERVVAPAEISNLAELTAFVAFAGNYPIAKTKLIVRNFLNSRSAFE